MCVHFAGRNETELNCLFTCGRFGLTRVLTGQVRRWRVWADLFFFVFFLQRRICLFRNSFQVKLQSFGDWQIIRFIILREMNLVNIFMTRYVKSIQCYLHFLIRLHFICKFYVTSFYTGKPSSDQTIRRVIQISKRTKFATTNINV